MCILFFPFLERDGDSHGDERRHVGCDCSFPSLTFFRKLFHLFLNKQDFKFSSGHFIAYKVPFALNKVMRREPLHGHNYHVTVLPNIT